MHHRKPVLVNKVSPVMRPAWSLFITLLSLVLAGCVLRPEWQKLAADQELQTRRLDTGRFQHLVLEKNVPGDHLLIYVEGDGAPWIHDTRVAVDPTPANPVLLRLMGESVGAAVYLGRPCYFGLSTSKGCEPRLWTFDRYGREIVESMCLAANEIARQHGAQSVQLIGYSGGGTIVVGMRSCVDRLVAVTTIAANLDPRAWTEFHEYSPLNDLNPLDSAEALPGLMLEIHWQCQDDHIIPPQITDAYFAAAENAQRRIVQSCSHASGWKQYWSAIVAR
jgi:hypothetical protein